MSRPEFGEPSYTSGGLNYYDGGVMRPWRMFATRSPDGADAIPVWLDDLLDEVVAAGLPDEAILLRRLRALLPAEADSIDGAFRLGGLEAVRALLEPPV